MNNLSALEIAALELEVELQEGLPHLFSFKWYPWARDFFESVNRINLLCAGNQISKSSTQIRKCIEWATNKELWKSLWPGQKPNQFWYLYPSQKVVDSEAKTKWLQFLPSGKFKTDPRYGWKWLKDGSHFIGIQFNSGIILNFKTYSQRTEDLQTGTIYAIFCLVAGTKVITQEGIKGIEEVREGEEVLSKDGWKKAQVLGVREQPIFEAKLSNGEALLGSFEHPVWTENRGWVQLGELAAGDICITVPLWNRIKKSSFLRANYSTDSLKKKTSAHGTILGAQVASFSMWRSGKRILVEKFRKVTLSTIAMGMRSITGQKISSSLPALSTQPTTNAKNGETQKLTPTPATRAEKNSCPEAQKVLPQEDALSGVEKEPIWRRVLVCFVKNLFSIAKTPIKSTVLACAPTGRTEKVYNLNVEGSHTYFANGCLTHNCDEELPVKHYEEIMFRISASDGYFHMVFTATLGQEFWRQVMEPDGVEAELLPHAWKRQVSLFEAMFYEDGSASHWTNEKIQIVMNRCPTHDEIMRRVYGKFVVPLAGRKYPAFDAKKHFIKPHRIPDDWEIYEGVDIGSGGEEGHPGAITFIAVDPKYTQGRVFCGWRGDDKANTTAGDIMERHLAMKHERGLKPTRQFYDQASRDFRTIAERIHEPFEPAEKGHAIGEDILNLLFKHSMLLIFDEDVELQKLGRELSSLKKSTSKKKAKDDFADSMRYGLTQIPWDLDRIASAIVRPPEPIKEETYEEQCLRERRERIQVPQDELNESYELEFQEYNELYGS